MCCNESNRWTCENQKLFQFPIISEECKGANNVSQYCTSSKIVLSAFILRSTSQALQLLNQSVGQNANRGPSFDQRGRYSAVRQGIPWATLLGIMHRPTDLPATDALVQSEFDHGAYDCSKDQHFSCMRPWGQLDQTANMAEPNIRLYCWPEWRGPTWQ